MMNKYRIIFLLLLGWWISIGLHAVQVNLNFFVGRMKIHTETVESGRTYTLSTIVPNSSMSAYECRDYHFRGWKEEAPIAGDETFVPAEHTTVTPLANVNLYAVFEKDETNRFIRITTLDNLEAGAQYMIICYSVYGDEPQYYAMNNEKGTYTYNNTSYHKLGAWRYFPRNGVITEPRNSEVWRLEGSTGNWKWIPINTPTQSLYIGNNSRWALLDTDDNRCRISVANGIFTIMHRTNDVYLKYVDDEVTEDEDYFITGTNNNYPIYLYKKESAFTSYPDCAAWTVYLDAGDGTISGTSPAVSIDTLVEASAGANITLPSATMGGGLCTGWSFAGWSVETPINNAETAPTLHSAGAYSPLYNGVSLYAVFTKTETVTYFERITAKTQITRRTGGVDDEYIIVNRNENQAISTSYAAAHASWTMVDITANGGIITMDDATAAGNVIWKYDGTRFNGKNTNSPLAYDQNNKKYFYVLNDTPPFYFQQQGNDRNHLWWYTGITYVDDDVDYTSYINYRFYIYKKITKTVTTYTSYPHCTPYSITLHGCGGTIGVNQNLTLSQPSATIGINLPSAEAICSGWEFVGWFVDEDKPSFEHVEFTDVQPAGTPFVPKYDGMHLYAVYKKNTNKYRILYSAADMVENDYYLVTRYAKSNDPADLNSYDWEITSNTYSGGTYLTSFQGEAPQGASGYYIEEDDNSAIWYMEGTYTDCTLLNKGNNKYLVSTSGGNTKTDNVGTSYRFVTHNDDAQGTFSFSMYDNDNSRYMTYNATDQYFSTSTSETQSMFVYRLVKEYTSWPHCDTFTVSFNACGGSADDGTLAEAIPYAGVVLPQAYVNADCDKEGWEFAGWATSPVMEETDLQTFDLLAPGTTYHPLSTTTTLYAVYQLKTNKYKRITTVGRLHTGVNYIIATSDNKALKNLPHDNVSIASQTVTPDASQIITNDDPALDWRLDGVPGEYEVYNAARKVYLDWRNGKAQLPHAGEVEKQDNFQITYSAANDYKLRSNRSLLAWDEEKYVGLNGANFTAVVDDDAPAIYFYRQQSTYHSYPNCVNDIDVVKWITEGDDHYVVVENYHLEKDPDMHHSLGDPDDSAKDGTYTIAYNADLLPPCSETIVEWDQVSATIKIPYVVTSSTTSTALLGATDCSTCDLYIMPGQTFTVNSNKTLHTVTVPDGATLNIANGYTLKVNALVLFSEGDQGAPVVNLNNNGTIELKHGRIYHDRRIDENRYYFFSLPFDTHLKEISYSNEAANGPSKTEGKIPRNRVDFWLKYYNGALRAADANGGALATTYWSQVAAPNADYTLQAGQGYEIGIDDQADSIQADGLKHKKRTIRFTMRPDNATWLNQERTGMASKVTNIVASSCNNPRNDVHAGWNFIGNPYMHSYNTTSVTGSSGLRNGAWKQELDEYNDPTGWWIPDDTRDLEVPYFTIYHPELGIYAQERASVYASLKPFEAVFVQINEGSQINFTSAMNVSAMPAYKRFLEPEKPLWTGIEISGQEQSDHTGIVLSDEFTPAYEIGGDLSKMLNNRSKNHYALNLYTLNSYNQELAFNAMSEEDAIEPIPVGVTFPASGEYTFTFDAQRYNAAELDSVVLIDNDLHQSVNLLQGNYTFVIEGEQTCNDRFALLIRRAKSPQIATDLDNTYDPNQPHKIIRDGHLFILRDEEMYNAIGTKIR